MKLLIIVPAFNEEDNIQNVIENLENKFSQYDYLVVNDGSTDNTAEVCKENNYNMLDLPINLGLAGGFQTGIKYAYENGYDAALQFDGDGQHQPEYIENMIQTLEAEEADIVIGSRFVNKKKNFNIRMLGSNIIELAIRITTGTVIKDPTSGMRLLNKNVLKRFAYQMNYGPEPDTISYLIRCGIRVKEVQVQMKERTAGESYLNLKRSILYMFRMCASIIFIQAFRKRSV